MRWWRGPAIAAWGMVSEARWLWRNALGSGLLLLWTGSRPFEGWTRGDGGDPINFRLVRCKLGNRFGQLRNRCSMTGRAYRVGTFEHLTTKEDVSIHPFINLTIR